MRPAIIALFALAAALGSSAAVSIDTVYFAQTHVQEPAHPYFYLVGNRDTLIKAHVVDPATPASPPVTAILTLDGQTLNLPLTVLRCFPRRSPTDRASSSTPPANSFTAMIPKAWVKSGLTVTVTAGAAQADFNTLKIGAPTKVVMTMFDVQYFADTNNDYPAGWKEELEAKWPVAELEVRRIPHVVFPELVIPPRGGAPAARVKSKADYTAQTGLGFDGEQAAALAWNGALKAAAGKSGRISLYYTNIYGVGAGGQAGGFAGVGSGTSVGILHHELGHALSLPHWGDSTTYPYKGAMHGIAAPAIYNETHAGPTWAFDPPTQAFIPCTVQPDNVGAKPAGTYKADPMQGGGTGCQEPGYLMNHFSDYSVFKMRSYLDGHVLVWNEALGQYAYWNQTARDYTNMVTNNGVNFPIERDVPVISVMASISGANPVSQHGLPAHRSFHRRAHQAVRSDGRRRPVGGASDFQSCKRQRPLPAHYPGRSDQDLHAGRIVGTDRRSAVGRQPQDRRVEPARRGRHRHPDRPPAHSGCGGQRPAGKPAGALFMAGQPDRGADRSHRQRRQRQHHLGMELCRRGHRLHRQAFFNQRRALHTDRSADGHGLQRHDGIQWFHLLLCGFRHDFPWRKLRLGGSGCHRGSATCGSVRSISRGG